MDFILEQQVKLNAVNSDFFQDFLKNEYNFCRFEFESCGYKQKLPGGRHSLHIPFYQTNTSQYCTLYARCREGQRGRQKLVTACPRYCEDYVFSYPDHLHMIGKYNSLFINNMSKCVICVWCHMSWEAWMEDILRRRVLSMK